VVLRNRRSKRLNVIGAVPTQPVLPPGSHQSSARTPQRNERTWQWSDASEVGLAGCSLGTAPFNPERPARGQVSPELAESHPLLQV
jgi:hypothetical protein